MTAVFKTRTTFIEPEELGQWFSDRIVQLVLFRPGLSEIALRDEYIRQYKTEISIEIISGLLSSLADEGVVELVQESRVITVQPSLRTLRSRSEDVSLSDITDSYMETRLPMGPGLQIHTGLIPAQEFPHHLKEGRSFPIVVMQVYSPQCFWFNLLEDLTDRSRPVYFDAMEELMDRMEKFYSGIEGDRWKVDSVSRCSPGTVLAARYLEQGFHRVLVKEVINLKSLKLFYIDYGSTATQKLCHVRFLSKEFAELPGQAIKARLWGLQKPEGKSVWNQSVKTRLLELVEGEPGSIVAKVMFGVGRRNIKVVGPEELVVDLGLTLVLVNIMLGHRGTNVGATLVAEGLARWEMEVGERGGDTVGGETGQMSSKLGETIEDQRWEWRKERILHTPGPGGDNNVVVTSHGIEERGSHEDNMDKLLNLCRILHMVEEEEAVRNEMREGV